MIIKIIRDGHLMTLMSAMKHLDSNPDVTGIMIYTCDNNGFPEDAFNKILQKSTKHVFGGVFPNLIYDGQKQDYGSILIGFISPLLVKVFHNIHHPSDTIPLELHEFKQQLHEGHTFFVNMDGLSEGIESFKEQLFQTLGLSRNYIGGGAGNISFKRKPCIITNEGLLQDAAVIALSSVFSGIGVSHGWNSITQEMLVTESVDNQIISLNWEPAFYVYQGHVEELSGLSISKDNFFDIAKAYPFGILKSNAEIVVRDPIGIKDYTNLVCVGAVPQNSVVSILNGDVQSLIEGARKAKQIAEEAFYETNKKKASEESVILFIDCISRVLFLEDSFQDEIDAINSDHVIGVLTLGEIANTGQSYLELYNKTAVIGILED